MTEKTKNFIRFFPDNPPQVVGSPKFATLLDEDDFSIKEFNWDSYNANDNDRNDISEKIEEIEFSSDDSWYKINSFLSPRTSTSFFTSILIIEIITAPQNHI